MSEIVLNNITKRFGESTAVKNLNLTIHDEEFVTLLGPSGCGKTTILRMIAGLETPSEGDIYIDDKLVFSHEKGINASPVKRNVGFLFQNYALWPHMSVYKNITFGLENMKWKKADIKIRVDELTKLLKIEDYLDRYPSELSGGQQQRVAIARTLAPNPKILFMDEPLSNLDAKLRMEMRSELKRIHRETDSTFVYVTHDQLEAMTLSTRISLFESGVLQQFSKPLEVYNYPTNTFVGNFVGSPTMNFIEMKCIEKNEDTIILKNSSLTLKYNPEGDLSKVSEGEKYTLGIRPEQITTHTNQGIEGEVYSSLPSGLETVFKVSIGDIIFTCVSFGGEDFEIGEKIKINFESERHVLFDETNQRIMNGSLEFMK